MPKRRFGPSASSAPTRRSSTPGSRTPAALQLTLSLRQRNIRIIYFASYDPARNSLRAEMPDDPGLCRDTSIRALLRTLE